MKKLQSMKIALIATAALATVACSSTPSTPTYRVNAFVHSVDRAPDVCTQQREGGGNAIVGGLLGGLIGNQFGSGNGRIAMTLVGAGTGAAVASGGGSKDGKMQCSRDGFLATVSYIHPADERMVTTTVPLERRTSAQYISISVK